jgi:hypothetical protein
MRALVGCLSTLALLGGVAGAQLPLGPEVPVNEWTAASQNRPAIAADGARRFVVVWESFAQDGSHDGVYARLYDGAAAPRGGEFRVNGHTADAQHRPAVAAADDGRFVVVWESYGQDGDRGGIYGQRFDGSGAALQPEFLVNVTTAGVQQRPAVALRPDDGSFVAVWESLGQDGSGSGVYARRYDGSGAPLGSELAVNQWTTGHQEHPAVAMAADGGFLVTWQGLSASGTDTDVYARRYDSSAGAAGLSLTREGSAVPQLLLRDDGRVELGSGSSTAFVLDPSGLGLAAIQALHAMLTQKEAELEAR